MFLDKNSCIDELVFGMQKTLVKNAMNEDTAHEEKILKAASLLNDAAEIFDEEGMSKEAEFAVALLEVIAGKKKKKKPAKKKDKELSSEDMEENYKTKGWAFNQDKNSANDQNCAACGAPKRDENYAKEQEFQKMLDTLNTDAPEDFEDDWDVKVNNDPFKNYPKTELSDDEDEGVLVHDPFAGYEKYKF